MGSEYGPDELRQAYLTDEVSRYARMQHERGPDYAVLTMPDREAEVADLTPDEVDAAVWELASERGLDPAEVAEQVLILSGGERDTQSRARALAELSELDEDDALRLTVSAEKREKLADKGKGFALPDGRYPIADAKHLGTAKAFYKQGKLAGHSAAEVKAHINRAAKRLGLPGLDDDEDEGDEENESTPKRKKRKPPVRGQKPGQGSSENVAPFPGAGEGGEGPSGAGPGGELAASAKRLMVRTPDGIHTIALTDGQAAEVLGLSAGTMDPVSRIVSRHPELFVPLAAPSAFELPESFRPPVEVHDVGDDGDPTEADGGRTAAVIARLQRDHPGEFGREKPGNPNATHRR